jgi:peptide/nickel transport system permease protein
LYLIPLFFGITIVVFILTRLAGDPVALLLGMGHNNTAAQRALISSYLGISGNYVDQYIKWLTNFLTLNFGVSFYTHISVNATIWAPAWNTIELQLFSLLLSLAIAIPMGIMSARKQYSKMDMAVTTGSLFGVSMPVFFVGIIFILVFSFWLGWFPWGGITSPPGKLLFNNLILDEAWHLFLPLIVLTIADLASFFLLIRSSMLEVLRQDYILAAQASGLSERTVIYKHALRNALIPLSTYIGLYLGGMLGGAPITETVFQWPGLGKLYVAAITDLDYPVVQAVTMLITLMVLIANLITDILYAYIDPRIRLD